MENEINSPIGKIIDKIKHKRELSGIDSSFVKESLQNYLRKIGIDNADLATLKHSQRKLIIKKIRSELRKLSGQFQKNISFAARKKLVEENNIIELLKTNISASERLAYYPELAQIINDLNPGSVLDLACGLNPIALFHFKLDKNIVYYASDIKHDELRLIDIYFNKNKIKGKTSICDLKKISSNYNNLPKVDLCLLLKTFDVIETSGHKLAEKIIVSLNCRHIITSFSTKTLSNKPMRHPQRGWIELLLTRLNYQFKLIKTKNEIFYLIKTKDLNRFII